MYQGSWFMLSEALFQPLFLLSGASTAARCTHAEPCCRSCWLSTAIEQILVFVSSLGWMQLMLVRLWWPCPASAGASPAQGGGKPSETQLWATVRLLFLLSLRI